MQLSKKGFTIIELLIVVAIISLIATLTLVRFQTVQKRGRDTRRQADVTAIAQALNLYNNDFSGYPVFTGFITSSDAMSVAIKNARAMSAVPIDPINGVFDSVDYRYQYTSDGVVFEIQYCLETNDLLGKVKGCSNYIRP